tara:strand:- start:713 stop:1102 length:390 start_codon:yes stop_codon:yes gene_type:complete
MEIIIRGLHIRNKKNNMRVGKRKVFKSPEVRDYEQDLHDEIMAQYRGPVLEGPVSVLLEITQPDKRRRDAHNAVDCILDVMQDVLIKDDANVHDLRVKKFFGKEWCLRIAVEPIAEVITLPFLAPCRAS